MRLHNVLPKVMQYVPIVASHMRSSYIVQKEPAFRLDWREYLCYYNCETVPTYSVDEFRNP